MTRPALLTILSVAGLGACAAGAAAAPPSAPLLAARLLADAATEPTGGARVRPVKAAPKRRSPGHAKAAAAAPLVRVGTVNRSVVRETASGVHVGAIQVYPWAEGSIYRLYTAPEQVSDIVLQPGEALISVAAGDTARWIIGDTSSGSGASRRVHILVKPSAMGLKTNLLIATDRRVYHVELESNGGTAMASISWTYPEDPLLALKTAPAAASGEQVAGVAVEALNFDSRIDGDNPPWRPLRAFDDGRQVFIEFPPAIAQGEAPPLFVTGESGRPELVNYRLRGRYYIVDRLFAAAELRLGEKRQQLVRIVRAGGPQRGRSGL
jgi:type IV secretion system protein VirB9